MTLLARHQFWSPAHRPMLSNGPLRTVPLRMGGSFLSYGTPFMGQQTSPLNRLDNIAVSTIMNRILASAPVQELQAALAAVPAQKNRGAWGRGSAIPAEAPTGVAALSEQASGWGLQLPVLTADENSVLNLIANAPTDDELGDLAIIDGFFKSAPNQFAKTATDDLTQQVCAGLKKGEPVSIASPNPGYQGGGGGFGAYRIQKPDVSELILAWFFPAPPPAPEGGGGGGWGIFRQKPAAPPPNVPQEELDALKDSKFFCGPENSYAYMNPQFGISTSEPWGNVKMQVKNAVILGNVIASYPFPPPIDQYKEYFWVAAASDIQKIISSPTPIDPETARFWLTVFIIGNYNAMTDKIQSDLKREAKKKKRKMILEAVGLAVLGIAAAIVLPAVIAAAVAIIKTAITTYVQIEDMKKAAKAMADSAKLFEKDAPEFAKEAQHAAEILDVQAAMQEANAPNSPDMQAAIDEVAADTPSSVSPLVPIGGLAAAAAAVFLIFRR